MRYGRILFGFLLALLFVGVVAGVGWYAYNAGVAHGIAVSGQEVPPTVEGNPAPVAPYWYYRPFGWFPPFGFGLLWCLVPLGFLFLFFVLLRFAFGGPRWRRWDGHGMYGPGGWGQGQGDIPPKVRELHRRLHEQEAANPPPTGQAA